MIREEEIRLKEIECLDKSIVKMIEYLSSKALKLSESEFSKLLKEFEAQCTKSNKLRKELSYYYLRKLIESMYGREDYLADTVEPISATAFKPELPEGLALATQENHESKKFKKALNSIAQLMKTLAVKQYLESILHS